MEESQEIQTHSDWKIWSAWFFLMIGCSVLFSQWEITKTAWMNLFPAILLISGVAAMVDFLLHNNERSLFMGTLLCLISLFIFLQMFLTPAIPFWKNELWLSTLFIMLGVSFFLFVMESGSQKTVWIAYLCVAAGLLQWLLQSKWLQNMQWISYLALGLIFIGIMLISYTRKRQIKRG